MTGTTIMPLSRLQDRLLSLLQEINACGVDRDADVRIDCPLQDWTFAKAYMRDRHECGKDTVTIGRDTLEEDSRLLLAAGFSPERDCSGVVSMQYMSDVEYGARHGSLAVDVTYIGDVLAHVCAGYDCEAHEAYGRGNDALSAIVAAVDSLAMDNDDIPTPVGCAINALLADLGTDRRAAFGDGVPPVI